MKKIDEVAVVKEDECVEEAKNAFLSIALIVGIITIIVGICVAVYNPLNWTFVYLSLMTLMTASLMKKIL